MTLDLRRWAFAFLGWLALAVVLAPALDPVGSPLVQTTGSAFNVFTSDVSLGPSRAAEPERNRKVQALPTGGSDGGAMPAAAALVPLATPLQIVGSAAVPARIFAIARPLGDAAGLPFHARAPPLLRSA